MNTSAARLGRIDRLHKQAKTGKYNWDQLLIMAKSTGVSTPTAKSYLDDVRARLIKEGLIKA